MFFKCVLLLLLPFTTCFGEELKLISSQSNCQIQPVGGRTHFACPFQNYFNYSHHMKWQKKLNNYAILRISTDKSLVVNDDRFKVNRISSAKLPGDLDFYELRIRDLRESDSGHYHCEIQSSNTTKHECEMHLTVSGAPVMLHNTPHLLLNAALMVFIVGMIRSVD